MIIKEYAGHVIAWAKSSAIVKAIDHRPVLSVLLAIFFIIGVMPLALPDTANAEPCSTASVPAGNFDENRNCIPNTGSSLGTPAPRVENGVNPSDVSDTTTAEGAKKAAEGNLDATAEDKCYELAAGSGLGWIGCPLFSGVLGTVNFIESFINDRLTISTDKIFDDRIENDKGKEPGTSYHLAWNSFRYLALGLIVVAALVIVVSQAAGMEMMSAYAVRKTLPRLLFAAIFITLSWNVMELLVTLSNDAGNGIRALISTPFIDNFTYDPGSGDFLNSVFATLLVGGIAFVGGLGIFGVFLTIITALLGALVALLIFVVRELILIFLIIIAPLAIACYILPNTQKVWAIWKGALISVLIVFPIISGMIAMGRVFAAITFRENPTIFDSILAIFAYIAPYFLMTMAFQLTGGLIATVSGMANDRDKGIFDRLRNARTASAAAAWDRTKRGERYAGSNALSKGFNSATRTAGIFGQARNKTSFLTNKGYRDDVLAGYNLTTSEDFAKENVPFNKFRQDGHVMAALAVGNDRAKMEKMSMFKNADGSINYTKMDEASTTAAAIGLNNRSAAAAAYALGDFNKVSAGGQAGRDDMDLIYASVAGGNQALRGTLSGDVQYRLRQNGRMDLGRDNKIDYLREMDISKLGQAKANGIEGIVDDMTNLLNDVSLVDRRDEKGNLYADIASDSAGNVIGKSGRVLDGNGQPVKKEFVEGLLERAVAAQHNTYISDIQQQALQQTLKKMPVAAKRAEDRYAKHMYPGGSRPTSPKEEAQYTQEQRRRAQIIEEMRRGGGKPPGM